MIAGINKMMRSEKAMNIFVKIPILTVTSTKCITPVSNIHTRFVCEGEYAV